MSACADGLVDGRHPDGQGEDVTCPCGSHVVMCMKLVRQHPQGRRAKPAPPSAAQEGGAGTGGAHLTSDLMTSRSPSSAGRTSQTPVVTPTWAHCSVVRVPSKRKARAKLASTQGWA